MNASFKFGDHVVLKGSNGSNIGIVTKLQDGAEKGVILCVVAFEHYKDMLVKSDELELVPLPPPPVHPDTKRLDWLESAFLEGKDNRVEYDFNNFVVCVDGFPELGLHFDELREAIDAAMRAEKEAEKESEAA